MRNKSGITLIETIATVVILAVGIVVVYQPLLRSLTVLNDMDYRLEVNRLESDQIWMLENDKTRLRSLAGRSEQGQLVGFERVYDYRVSVTPISADRVLNHADFRMEWKISGRSKQLTHSWYVEIPSAHHA